MTAQPLHPPGVASRCLAAARLEVANGLSVPVGTVGDSELDSLAVELTELSSQVEAWRLQLLAEGDRRRAADSGADTDTASWWSRLTTDPREVAAGGVWLARRLEEKYAATLEALTEGRLRPDQARVIVAAGDRAPAGITPEQLTRAEADLVAKATGEGTASGRPMGAKRLRFAARRMFESISKELADRHESDQLGEEEREAEARTFFTMTDNADGTCTGRFLVSELHGRILRSWLERLTAPRRDRSGRGESEASAEGAAGAAAGGGGAERGGAAARGGAGTSDPTRRPGLSYSERAGQAFSSLIEHLPQDGWGAGSGIGLLVRVDLEALRTGIGAAGLDSGTRCSASEARRLACSAGIIPVVLGAESLPLDLGRTRRLHSEGQRRALAHVWDSCAVESCDRPFAWVEVHHPDAWQDLGETNLDNGLPLCAHHHRRAHDDRFHLTQPVAGVWTFRRRRPAAG